MAIIRERGRRSLPLERVQHLLYHRELYLRAYAKLYPNKGALIRRVMIPKADGTRRPLGVTSWRDKLLQEVIRSTLEAYCMLRCANTTPKLFEPNDKLSKLFPPMIDFGQPVPGVEEIFDSETVLARV